MTSPVRPLPARAKLLAAHSPWLAILAVAGVFAVYAAAHALWLDDEDAAVPPVPAIPAARAPLHERCATCGVIEAIRATPATADKPAGWTLVVRMRDGSLRQSNEPLPGNWQVGEGIQLIGGERAWSVPGR